MFVALVRRMTPKRPREQTFATLQSPFGQWCVASGRFVHIGPAQKQQVPCLIWFFWFVVNAIKGEKKATVKFMSVQKTQEEEDKDEDEEEEEEEKEKEEKEKEEEQWKKQKNNIKTRRRRRGRTTTTTTTTVTQRVFESFIIIFPDKITIRSCRTHPVFVMVRPLDPYTWPVNYQFHGYHGCDWSPTMQAVKPTKYKQKRLP